MRLRAAVSGDAGLDWTRRIRISWMETEWRLNLDWTGSTGSTGFDWTDGTDSRRTIDDPGLAGNSAPWAMGNNMGPRQLHYWAWWGAEQ